MPYLDGVGVITFKRPLVFCGRLQLLVNSIFNGIMPDAVGIPEDQLRKAAKSAVCKINIDSDSRLAFTAAVRKVLAEKPGEFDPRKYCGPARDEMTKLYKHKIIEVLGSDGKAE